MNNSILLILLYAIAFIFISVLLGFYVYNDSKSRNMNPTLWTVITIFTSYIGFIVYLIVRKNNPIYNCPNCNQPINLKWTFCPNCSENISSQKLSVNYTKDKKLKWIIPLIVIIPILTLSISILDYNLSSKVSLSGNISSINHMDNADVKLSEVQNWIKNCDSQGKGIYILKISDAKNVKNYYEQYSNNEKNS